MASLPLSSLCPRSPRFLRHCTADDKIRVPVCRVYSQKKKVFPNLQADDFRHPVDKEAAERFRAAPNMKEIEEKTRAYLVAERTKYIGDIEKATLATPSQHSNLYNLMAETADILSVKPPSLYVQPSSVMRAHLVSVDDEPYIVFHTSLLELLTRQEQQVVLAHELAHLMCNHYMWLKCVEIFVHEVKAIPDSFFESEFKDIFRQAQAADLSCDRASLLVSQDPKVVVSTIMKMTGGYPNELDVDGYLARARAYLDASTLTAEGHYRETYALRLPEPVPFVRAYEIDQWAKSKDYKRLLFSATTVGQAIMRRMMIDDKILDEIDIEQMI